MSSFRYRILMVDDDAALREIGKALLQLACPMFCAVGGVSLTQSAAAVVRTLGRGRCGQF
jgi:hypothetical protein